METGSEHALFFVFCCSESDTTVFNTHGNTLDLSQKAQLIHAAATATQPHCIKTETQDTDPLLTAMTSVDTSTTLTHPATIILATTTSSTTQELSHSPQAVFPTTTVHIKTEPMDGYDTLQEQTGETWCDFNFRVNFFVALLALFFLFFGHETLHTEKLCIFRIVLLGGSKTA